MSDEKMTATPPTPGELPTWARDEAYRLVCENSWGWEESASDELTSDQEQHVEWLAGELVKIVAERLPLPDAGEVEPPAEAAAEAIYVDGRECKFVPSGVAGAWSIHDASDEAWQLLESGRWTQSPKRAPNGDAYGYWPTESAAREFAAQQAQKERVKHE